MKEERVREADQGESSPATIEPQSLWGRPVPKTGYTVGQFAVAFLGTALSLGALAILGELTGYGWVIAPFGATAVLLYCVTQSPLVSPKNVVFGHLISAVVAIACVNLFGQAWFTAPVAVTLAIIFMMLTGTTHPPGGATALLIVTQNVTDWFFVVAPLIPGVVLMMAVTVLVTSLVPTIAPYPVKK